MAGVKSGYFSTRSVKVAFRAGEIDLRELEQAFQVSDDLGIALGGLDLVQRVAGLASIAGGQRREEQCLADGGQSSAPVQRVLQVAHRGIDVAHAHPDRGQPGLHADVVRRQRLGLLERLDASVARPVAA